MSAEIKILSEQLIVRYMKTLLTLDYELHIGTRTGSVEKCLFEPMRRLTEVAERYGARFTIFVDSAYLVALKEVNRNEYDAVCQNIRQLHETGHDIELHIHPQWLFSSYENGEWQVDEKHYRLSQLTTEDAVRLFKQAKECLEGVVGKKITGYRAGGFSAQPSELLTHLFAENGIVVDSSVMVGEKYDSELQWYDYSNAPQCSYYRFENDICEKNDAGRFVEVPISTTPISPIFHWRLVANRFIGGAKHRLFGDGFGFPATTGNILKRLTRRVMGPCVIDGLKIGFLHKAFKNHLKRNEEYFCVLGHPKLATPYSIAKLEEFLKATKDKTEYITLDKLVQ